MGRHPNRRIIEKSLSPLRPRLTLIPYIPPIRYQFTMRDMSVTTPCLIAQKPQTRPKLDGEAIYFDGATASSSSLIFNDSPINPLPIPTHPPAYHLNVTVSDNSLNPSTSNHFLDPNHVGNRPDANCSAIHSHTSSATPNPLIYLTYQSVPYATPFSRSHHTAATLSQLNPTTSLILPLHVLTLNHRVAASRTI